MFLYFGRFTGCPQRQKWWKVIKAKPAPALKGPEPFRQSPAVSPYEFNEKFSFKPFLSLY
jgi:hypothetical protein